MAGKPRKVQRRRINWNAVEPRVYFLPRCEACGRRLKATRAKRDGDGVSTRKGVCDCGEPFILIVE